MWESLLAVAGDGQFEVTITLDQHMQNVALFGASSSICLIVRYQHRRI